MSTHAQFAPSSSPHTSPLTSPTTHACPSSSPACRGQLVAMSAAGVGTVGVNKVASEALNTNVPRAYTEWVAGGYPPKLGRFMEVPFKFWGGALAVGFAAAGACVWANRKLFATTVHTMTPQFQAEAARIGPVAQRTDAPPVFLNPIYNRIPGRFLGPEDVEAETK